MLKQFNDNESKNYPGGQRCPLLPRGLELLLSEIMTELERVNTWQEKVNSILTELKVEIATLKVKSFLLGAVAAIILTAVLNFFVIELTKSDEVFSDKERHKIEEIVKQESEKPQ